MYKTLKDKVILEIKKVGEKTASGLIVPETAKETQQEGTVVAVGPKVESVKIGDVVIYGKFIGFEVSIDDKEHIIINEEDILAIK